MTRRYVHPDEFELASRRDSTDSKDSFDLDAEDPETQTLTSQAYVNRSSPSIWSKISSFLMRKSAATYRPLPQPSSRQYRRAAFSRRFSLRRVCFILHALLLIILALIILTAVFRPSYTNRPQRYNELRQLAVSSKEPGRANTLKEKIFIATSIFDPDGSLADGDWGKEVLELVDLLGPENVFLSIYENDAGPKAKEALDALERKVKCEHKFVFEEHLDPKVVPHITMPDKSSRVKRIAYLAEVRNRALKPMEDSDIEWNKLLYINDVVFNPIEAAQLLFSTGADKNPDGSTDYRAACAVDFINPFKFYDTFATRDQEGYSMGLPFYPWFTDSGKAQSRRGVLDQLDVVMVKSCWGGMVSFDAKYFQFKDANKLETGLDISKAPPAGFRFRAEEDMYWDSSECCLIHADIQSKDSENTGIYINPYVRVAYDSQTLSWLGFTRRFERLYSPVHTILNHIIGLPWYNPRRDEKPGTVVVERVWVPEPTSPQGGSFQNVERVAGNAGFCGRRALQLMLEHPVPGHKPYEVLPVPPLA